jgi:hypothetical protein
VLMELTPLGWIVVPILAVVGLLMALGLTMMIGGTKLVCIVAGFAMLYGGGYAVAAAGGFLSEYEYQPPHLLVDVLLAILGIALFIVGLIVLFAAWSWLPGLLARLVGTLFRCDHKGGYRHSYPCEWRDWLWEVQEAFEEDDKPYTDADYERRYGAFYFTEPRYREQLLREEQLYRERLYRQRDDDDWR